MRIEYVVTKSQRDVPDAIGEALVARRIARPVYETRELTAEGKKRRRKRKQYERRDLKAEDSE